LDKSSVCANENEHKPLIGSVVVRLATYRFAGIVITKTAAL